MLAVVACALESKVVRFGVQGLISLGLTRKASHPQEGLAQNHAILYSRQTAAKETYLLFGPCPNGLQ